MIYFFKVLPTISLQNLLKEKLLKHAEFENKVFYPAIDEKLSEEQKAEIVRKINELK